MSFKAMSHLSTASQTDVPLSCRTDNVTNIRPEAVSERPNVASVRVTSSVGGCDSRSSRSLRLCGRHLCSPLWGSAGCP